MRENTPPSGFKARATAPAPRPALTTSSPLEGK